jgi:DNA polymerase elongation subunit (family B)
MEAKEGEDLVCQIFNYTEDREGDGESAPEIHVWALDEASNPVHLRVLGYNYRCYTGLPRKDENGQVITWTNAMVIRMMDHVNKVLAKEQHGPKHYELTKKYYTYYYDMTKQPMIYLEFVSFNAMSHYTNYVKYPRLYKFDKMNLQLKLETHEVRDISRFRKLCTERNISFSGWIRVKGVEITSNLPTRTAREGRSDRPIREFACYAEHIESLSEVDSAGKATSPKIVSFDIENYSSNPKKFPDAEIPEDKTFLITIASQIRGKPDTMERYAILLGECKTKFPNSKIIETKTEKELFDTFWQVLDELDPDIITGYNILSYDFPYIEKRFTKNGGAWDMKGRLKDRYGSMGSISWESSAYGVNNLSFLVVDGRIVIDTFIHVKKEERLAKYDLGTVSSIFLGKTKRDLKARDMFAIYERYMKAVKTSIDLEKTIEGMSKVVDYGLEDASLPIEIFENRKMWFSLIEMSNVVGVSVQDLNLRGQQIRCMSQLYHEAALRDFVITKRDSQKVFISGGYCRDPLVGYHENVLCFDFASLYPSIIRAYNMCYTTLLRPEHQAFFENNQKMSVSEMNKKNLNDISRAILQDIKSECHVIEFDQEEPKKYVYQDNSEDLVNVTESDEEDNENKSDTVVRSYRYVFVKEDKRKGLVPEIVRKLVEKRSQARKRIANIEEICKDKSNVTAELVNEMIILDKRQNALKVAANSMYGFFGAQAGKMPLQEASMSVTAMGRKHIKEVNAYLENKYNAKIIYGDTDSSMFDIGIKDPSKLSEWGDRISKELSGTSEYRDPVTGILICPEVKGLFPPPLKIEFEKAMNILCIAKKKYAAYLINKSGNLKLDIDGNPIILERGIVVARRDNFKVLRDTYRLLLRSILDKKSAKSSFEIILNSVIRMLREDYDPVTEFTIIRGLGSTYKNKSYFMNVFASELANVGKPAAAGERLEYLIVIPQEEEKIREDACNATERKYLLGKKLRTIEWWLEEGKTKLDIMYYLKLFANPIDQLFQTAYSSIDFHKNIGYKAIRARTYVTLNTPVKMLIKIIEDCIKTSDNMEVIMKSICDLYMNYCQDYAEYLSNLKIHDH